LPPIRMHDGDNGAASIGKLLDVRADERRVSGEVCGGWSSTIHGWQSRDMNLIAGGFEGVGELGIGAWHMPASVNEDNSGLARGHFVWRFKS